jgi:hypothetical protein
MLSLGLVLGESFGKEDDDENRRTSPGFYRKGRVSHAQPWYAWPRNGNGRVGGRSFEMIVVSRRIIGKTAGRSPRISADFGPHEAGNIFRSSRYIVSIN